MMRAGQDYGVRMLVAYANRSVGRVIYPNGVKRDRLVKRGFEPVQSSSIENIKSKVDRKDDHK